MTDRPTAAPLVGRRRLGRAAAAFGLLALTGCDPSAILPEPPQLYTLTPKSTFPPDLPTVDWRLLIEPPVAAAGLDTVRIPLSRSPMTLDYYASVAWTDRAPSMIQRLLVESFENSDRIVSVGRDSIGLQSDYLLKTELREFQVEQWETGAAPRVRVRLNAKLVELPEREIITGETFEAVEPARSSAFGDIIQAYDTALGRVLRGVVEWTLATGEADWRTRRRSRSS